MIDLKTHRVLDDQLRDFAEEDFHQGVVQDRIHLGDVAKKRLVGGLFGHNLKIIKEIAEKQNAEGNLDWATLRQAQGRLSDLAKGQNQKPVIGKATPATDSACSEPVEGFSRIRLFFWLLL